MLTELVRRSSRTCAGSLIACSLLVALQLTVSDAFAAPEDVELAAEPSSRSVLMTRPDGSLDRDLVPLPADESGWLGEAVQPWDVARYLAHHKAALLEGEILARETPTPNQDLYDQTYFDIEIAIDTVARTFTSAATTMRATVVAGPLEEMEIDFTDDLTISSITVGGVPASWNLALDILTVVLDRPYATGEEVEIVVAYSGRPNNTAFSFSTFNGLPMIWTLSQPFGARTWWPCKDYPNDKPDSVDVRVTAQSGNRIVSNGALVSESDNGTVTTAHWRVQYPIATYLVHLGIYPYMVTTDTYTTSGGHPLDLVFYDFPTHASGNAPANALVDDMLAVYEDLFGEYPYVGEKYGHNESLFGGGMEHQTCTSLGAYFESIVAHEATHQWWGDLVTCDTYNHVWLNEGFATYGEALWFEAAYGQEAYLADMLANQYFGPGTIYVDDLTDTNRIFSSNLSYAKASWVLHMLRHVIGDANFFATLAAYRDQFAYDSATTEDFRDVAESVSGRDLDAFFQQWIYGESYPIYSFDWSTTPAAASWNLALEIEQLQTSQLFAMPIDVVVTTTAGTETFVVENALALEQYDLVTAAEPLHVELDPDQWILRQVLTPIPAPTFTRSTLLVNGVSWETYGSEIVASYQARAFWGDLEIEFWDLFDEPAGGYPATLPAPRGHGPVPGDILGEYENVIWVGNNFDGDLAGWWATPIYGYLQAGGNVLLLSRMGDQFLNEVFEGYLGVDLGGSVTVFDCIATELGFTNIGRIGQQSFTVPFDLAVGANTTLLYVADSGFNPNLGLGAVVEPPAGGEFDPDGGRLAFLAGRPYRWNASDLSANVERIFERYFGETPAAAPSDVPATLAFGIEALGANPFTSAATVRLGLPEGAAVQLDVLDVSGRRVRTLASGAFSAGVHTLTWDGRDEAQTEVPSGVYFVRLRAGEQADQVKVVRAR